MSRASEWAKIALITVTVAAICLLIAMDGRLP